VSEHSNIKLPLDSRTRFNTVSGKRIALFGFAFKKNTGDVRHDLHNQEGVNLLECPDPRERCHLRN